MQSRKRPILPSEKQLFIISLLTVALCLACPTCISRWNAYKERQAVLAPLIATGKRMVSECRDDKDFTNAPALYLLVFENKIYPDGSEEPVVFSKKYHITAKEVGATREEIVQWNRQNFLLQAQAAAARYVDGGSGFDILIIQDALNLGISPNEIGLSSKFVTFVKNYKCPWKTVVTAPGE